MLEVFPRTSDFTKFFPKCLLQGRWGGGEGKGRRNPGETSAGEELKTPRSHDLVKTLCATQLSTPMGVRACGVTCTSVHSFSCRLTILMVSRSHSVHSPTGYGRMRVWNQ